MRLCFNWLNKFFDISETELPVSMRNLTLFFAIDTLTRGREGASLLTLHKKKLFTLRFSVCVSASEEILIGRDFYIAFDFTNAIQIFLKLSFKRNF